MVSAKPLMCLAMRVVEAVEAMSSKGVGVSVDAVFVDVPSSTVEVSFVEPAEFRVRLCLRTMKFYVEAERVDFSRVGEVAAVVRAIEEVVAEWVRPPAQNPEA